MTISQPLDNPKILLLPKSEKNQTSYQQIELIDPRTSSPKAYILDTEEACLYELKEITGENPHLESNKLREETKNGSAVKSLIIQEKGQEGSIIQNPNFIVTTKFNFVYILISFFALHKEKFSQRYQSLEDFIDSISEYEQFENINKLPESIVQHGLENIADKIQEGDATFYKFSQDKTTNYLKQKIDTLGRGFPNSILQKLVKPSLYPVNINEEIPEKLVILGQLRHSIYLLSSYLSATTQGMLLSEYDFSELDGYLQNLKMAKEDAKWTQENLNRVAEQNSSVKPKKKAAVAKKPVAAKKQTKKVAVGKGALDGFFRKA